MKQHAVNYKYERVTPHTPSVTTGQSNQFGSGIGIGNGESGFQSFMNTANRGIAHIQRSIDSLDPNSNPNPRSRSLSGEDNPNTSSFMQNEMMSAFLNPPRIHRSESFFPSDMIEESMMSGNGGIATMPRRIGNMNSPSDDESITGLAATYVTYDDEEDDEGEVGDDAFESPSI